MLCKLTIYILVLLNLFFVENSYLGIQIFVWNLIFFVTSSGFSGCFIVTKANMLLSEFSGYGYRVFIQACGKICVTWVIILISGNQNLLFYPVSNWLLCWLFGRCVLCLRRSFCRYILTNILNGEFLSLTALCKITKHDVSIILVCEVVIVNSMEVFCHISLFPLSMFLIRLTPQVSRKLRSQ